MTVGAFFLRRCCLANCAVRVVVVLLVCNLWRGLNIMFLCKYSNSDSVCRPKDGPCSQRRPLSFCKSLSVRIYQLSPRATLSLTPVDQQTHCLSSRSPSFVGAELDPRLRGSRSQLIAADTLWSQLHAVPAWAPTSALVHVRCLLLCVVVVRVCMRELTRETDQQRERERESVLASRCTL